MQRAEEFRFLTLRFHGHIIFQRGCARVFELPRGMCGSREVATRLIPGTRLRRCRAENGIRGGLFRDWLRVR
jgi:hypothetical protein